MRRLLREKVIFDGRNLYEPKAVVGHGFTYHAIGRRPRGKEEEGLDRQLAWQKPEQA
jgi:hypothetical protein